MPDKLLLIINPCAGKKRAAGNLSGILEVFCKGGWLPTVAMTAYPGHAAKLSCELAPSYDLIVCAGGDGTLNEVISGLMRSGADRPVAYMPSGTTNDLGATLGLSKNPLIAAGDALSGNRIMLDIGRFNGRNFVYTASFGAFTRASYATPQAMKNILGHLAYVLEGAKEVWNIKPVRARIETDAGTFEGEYIFGSITNSTSLAGILTIDKKLVRLDDGLFELMLVEKPENAIEYSRLLNQVMRKKFDDKLKLYKVSRVEMHTESALDWTLDGEREEGSTDFFIENLKNAVRMTIPPTKDETAQ